MFWPRVPPVTSDVSASAPDAGLVSAIGTAGQSTAYRAYRSSGDAEELQIVRDSFPYGTISEARLFLSLYTNKLAIPERMLRRITGPTTTGCMIA